MRLHQMILILVCHVLMIVIGLPITSQPLASNPEHLTWDAWLMSDTRHPDHKPKKITPKSIFITPNLYEPAHICPPDHKLDHNNRCIQIVQINQHELLTHRLEALLGSTINTQGNEEYDYDYEEVDDGPFQLSLPLTFDVKKDENDSLQPFHVPPDSNETKETQESAVKDLKRDATTIASDAGSNGTPTSTEPTKSFSHFFSNKPHSTEYSSTVFPSTEPFTSAESSSSEPSSSELYRPSSTEPSRPFSSEPPELFSPTESSTDQYGTEPSSTESDSNSSSTEYAESGETTTEFVVSSTVESEGSSLFDSNVSSESPSSTAIPLNITNPTLYTTEETNRINENMLPLGLNQTSIQLLEDAIDMTNNTGEMEFFNEDGEMESFEDLVSDLENESLFIENRPGYSTSTTTATTTTSTTTTETPPPPNQSETPIFIVTPQPTRKWQPSLFTAPTRYHQKKDAEKQEFEIHVPDASGDDIVDIKHEQTQDYLDHLDSNNRFVYHHLTTPRASVTPTTPDILAQLKEINRIVAEQRLQRPTSTRIRFPEQSYNNRFSWPYSSVAWPSPTQQPTTRTITTTTTTTARPKWWLPNANWEVDESGQKPLLLRFWERMPLVRDPSIQRDRSGSRSQARRENSRSPSENLYKEISSQDLYKVLQQNSSRDWKHTNS